jgi:hypothetical protein
VTQQDWSADILAGVVSTVSIAMYEPFGAVFKRQKADLLGMRPGRTHAVLLVLIAAAVIGSYSPSAPSGLRAAGRPRPPPRRSSCGQFRE